MDDVEAKLRQVPKDSLDAPASQALLARIDAGRQQVQREAKERQQASEAALAPPVVEPSIEAPKALAPVIVADAGVPDAGSPEPVAGMSREEFDQRFLGCFSSKGPVRVGVDGGMGEAFELSADGECQAQFPSYKDRMVVADSNKVLGAGKVLSSPKPAVAADAGQP
jgi:hypothetical protein